jgi:hypothetical protein
MSEIWEDRDSVKALCESFTSQKEWDELGKSLIIYPDTIPAVHYFIINYAFQFDVVFPLDQETLFNLDRHYIQRFNHFIKNRLVQYILECYEWEFSPRAQHILDNTKRWSTELAEAEENVKKYTKFLDLSDETSFLDEVIDLSDA